MNQLSFILVLLGLNTASICQAEQMLTLDPESGKYTYTRTIELPGQTRDAIRKSTFATLGSPSGPNTLRNDKDWYIYNVKQWRLGGDAYLSYTTRIGFKDGKLRVELTDFSYDNRAWGFSAPERFENIDKSNKLNKVLEDTYNRLDKAIIGFTEKVKTNLRLTGDKEW